MSPEPDDMELLRRWEYFRDNYASLGFRNATYEYFATWQKKKFRDQVGPREIKRRLHATRKRNRLARRKGQSDDSEP